MRTQLHIAPDLALSTDYIVGTAGIFATKGMGKSHLAQVAAEEMLEAGHVIVAIDPTDSWYGLRSSADGKHDGYPVVIFGGDHGDAKLEPDGAVQLAEAIVAERFSCVICTDGLSDTAEIRFVRTLLDTIYRRNREPLHIFVDEADIFAPQKPFEVEDSRSIRAMSHIVRRGRRKGIGSTVITQRPSELNASVRSQVEMLFVLGMLNNLDIDAVEKWLRLRKKKGGDNAAFALQEEMIASLDTLQCGDAWLWAPRQKLHKRFRARPKLTFDSGATPKPGQRRTVAKKLAPVDIARIGAAMAAAVQRQKDNEPGALRARIVELELELERAPKEAPPKIIERPVISAKDLTRLQMALDGVRAYSGKLAEVAAHLEAITKPALETKTVVVSSNLPPMLHADAVRVAQQRRPKIGAPAPTYENGRPRIQRAMLIALAQHPQGLTRKKLRIHTGYADSGPTSSAIAILIHSGLVESHGDVLKLTARGRDDLGSYEPLPTGDALRELLLRGTRLGTAAKKMLAVICDAWPSAIARADIRERAGYADSGPTSSAMAHLVGLDYVQDLGRAGLRAADELFSRSAP